MAAQAVRKASGSRRGVALHHHKPMYTLSCSQVITMDCGLPQVALGLAKQACSYCKRGTCMHAQLPRQDGQSGMELSDDAKRKDAPCQAHSPGFSQPEQRSFTWAAPACRWASEHRRGACACRSPAAASGDILPSRQTAAECELLCMPLLCIQTTHPCLSLHRLKGRQLGMLTCISPQSLKVTNQSCQRRCRHGRRRG